ncbi:MAG: hypothetical protein AB2A00_35265 [Myxococcota bacterium]
MAGGRKRGNGAGEPVYGAKVVELLKSIDATLNTRLGRIENTLEDHSRMLGEHSRMLGEHSRMLGEHTRLLGEHGHRLTGLEVDVQGLTRELRDDRLAAQQERRQMITLLTEIKDRMVTEHELTQVQRDVIARIAAVEERVAVLERTPR